MNEDNHQIPVTKPKSGQRRWHTNVKPRSNSKFWQLEAAQREQVIAWLFEKNISCREVSKRCWDQFGLDWSSSCVSDFYCRENTKRNRIRILDSAKQARQIVKALGKSSKEAFQAMQHVVAHVAFNAALTNEPGEKPDHGLLMEAFPMLMDAQKDEREEQRLELERERWEFDVVRACLDHFKELQEIIANQSLDEPGRLKEIRRQLFGKNLPPEER
jgi:hypothetical protein